MDGQIWFFYLYLFRCLGRRIHLRHIHREHSSRSYTGQTGRDVIKVLRSRSDVLRIAKFYLKKLQMLNMTTMSALRFALVRAYKQWEGNMKGRTVGGLTDALRNCFAKCLINLRNFNSTWLKM